MKNFIIILVLFLLGCNKTIEDLPSERINNIVRVFFVNSHHYYVLTEDPTTKELKSHSFTGYSGGKITIIADCPNDKKMYVDICPKKSGIKDYTIHIHDASEIGPGNTGGKNSQQLNVVK
jgi:hypothetical protein